MGIRLANYFSKKSRYGNGGYALEQFQGEENEWLVQYAKRKLQQQPVDYFVFGHRHLPLDIAISHNCRYINLGDWLDYCSYAVFDGSTMELKYDKP
ncbi:MAG: hypothetical protein U0T84_06880 [Chitinophagales bacterium]